MLLSTSAPTGSTATPVGFAGYMMLQTPGGLNAICDQIRPGDVEDILFVGKGIARELGRLDAASSVIPPSHIAGKLESYINRLTESGIADVKGVRKQSKLVSASLRLVPDDQYGLAAESFVRSCGVYLSSNRDIDRRIEEASRKRPQSLKARILFILFDKLKMRAHTALLVGQQADSLRLAETLRPEGGEWKSNIDEGYRCEALGWRCAARVETDTTLAAVFHLSAMVAFTRAGKPGDAEKEYEKIKRLRGARTGTAQI